MYDKAYAQAWIADSESGKDIFRSQYIVPFLTKVLNEAKPDAKILDAGCGWGTVIPCLQTTHEYVGLDITTEFFPYIHEKYAHTNITLIEGGFPGPFPFEKNTFDVVICSMSLHTIEDLQASIQSSISVLKKGGLFVLVDFNSASFETLTPSFDAIPKGRHIKGEFAMMSGAKTEAEVFFHTEEEYKKELQKVGVVKKEALGPIFVGYGVKK
jgi:ubiquinone/menaquinone biosynthesis C-methylase UbiE